MRRSLADIVVATPGRLIDHMTKNSGLCLEHLRFLVSAVEICRAAAVSSLVSVCLLLAQVIDEADRMIDSMHQSWLSQVMGAVYRSRAEPGSVFRRTEAACITSARCVCVLSAVG